MPKKKGTLSLMHPYAGRHRKLGNDCTPFSYAMSVQHTGHPCTRLSQLHPYLQDQLNNTSELYDIPKHLATLDDVSVSYDYDDKEAMVLLKHIYASMINFESQRRDSNQTQSRYGRYGRIVIEHGGVEVMLRLLMSTSMLPPSSAFSSDSKIRLRTKALVLQILYRLISVNAQVAKDLAEIDELPAYLLGLFVHEETMYSACNILEDILQAVGNVFNLAKLTNLHEVVEQLDPQKLPNLCRLLAVTISDLDVYENKSSLFAQNVQKRTKGFVNVRDINQELLINIPGLLPRLVALVCEQRYVPRFRDQRSEREHWMVWIENAMCDEAFDVSQIDDLDSFIGSVSEPFSRRGPLVSQAGLDISTNLVLRVQVLYVLGLFLVGKHRKKVQKRIAELGLIPGMSELFDQFIWICDRPTQHRNPLRGHRSVCECSPEVAMKIQFLRLVHSFCDHSDHKHLLLSKCELNEVKRINAGNIPKEFKNNALDEIDKNLMCRGSKGLLTKIVEVMKSETPASTFRFWLARAVESYLRGGTAFCDQEFLLRRGLLQHIISNIVDNETRPKEILQSSFDLLGELIKFNLHAFTYFDKVFTADNFHKFVKVVNRNMVDSNMFLRSLFLTFDMARGKESRSLRIGEWGSKLLDHIGSFDQQLTYLHRLVSVINVTNLTQENVSCLNTTLVVLMDANRKQCLPQYLRALTREKASSRHTPHAPDTPLTGPEFMRAFRDLLLFWQDHYLHKDKDCSALERSSRIKFDYWRQTVCTLIAENRNSETSLLYYITGERDCGGFGRGRIGGAGKKGEASGDFEDQS